MTTVIDTSHSLLNPPGQVVNSQVWFEATRKSKNKTQCKHGEYVLEK